MLEKKDLLGVQGAKGTLIQEPSLQITVRRLSATSASSPVLFLNTINVDSMNLGLEEINMKERNSV